MSYEGETTTDAIYTAGYGAPSRLYEEANIRLGMTPASYAKGGKGAEILYAIVPSPMGRLMIAATPPSPGGTCPSPRPPTG